ncbi:MAG: AraC family transcriptional regulator, partial [Clostridia bacterium]|nr:AraC family transcriptional regulator [Clostridia bacterium]
HAKQLIDTYKDALLLYEVAILSGFSDYVYFSRRFKKFTGLSPQEYKNSK